MEANNLLRGSLERLSDSIRVRMYCAWAFLVLNYLLVTFTGDSGFDHDENEAGIMFEFHLTE